MIANETDNAVDDYNSYSDCVVDKGFAACRDLKP
jgi:hypothetical protein